MHFPQCFPHRDPAGAKLADIVKDDVLVDLLERSDIAVFQKRDETIDITIVGIGCPLGTRSFVIHIGDEIIKDLIHVLHIL